MRSPSVERFTCRSSAALDLLPLLTFNAQLIRFDSSSRMRSSSAIGVAWSGGARYVAADVFGGPGNAATAAIGSIGCDPARNRMPADTQPTRTVPQVQVWARRSHAFSSSRTLPGQL